MRLIHLINSSFISRKIFLTHWLMLEGFSFECRKVIGFAFTTLRDWFKKLAPLLIFIQSRVKLKPIVIHSYAFSRALRQLHVITSCFDWFTWLRLRLRLRFHKYMNSHTFTCILHLLRVYYELSKWPAPSWLDSSVGRALHRYRRGHWFESRSGLNFFQALISQLLKLSV